MDRGLWAMTGEVIAPACGGSQMLRNLKSWKQASRESRGSTDESLSKHTAGQS